MLQLKNDIMFNNIIIVMYWLITDCNKFIHFMPYIISSSIGNLQTRGSKLGLLRLVILSGFWNTNMGIVRDISILVNRTITCT